MATRIPIIVAAFFAISPAVAWEFPVSEAGGAYPPGFTRFCEERPTDCLPSEAAEISFAKWQGTIESVNAAVNRAITYKLDENQPSGDLWTIEPKTGDCDDYAITKMHRLLKAGVPRGAMRMAFAFQFEDIPHMMLLVDTDEGLLALDNRSDEIIEIEQYILSGLSVQDASDPKLWRKVY